VHGLGPNDLWAVAGPNLIHWDGTRFTHAYEDDSMEFNGVFEAAPGDIWLAGRVLTGQAAVVRIRNGVAETVPTTLGAFSFSAITGTGPNDIWTIGSGYSGEDFGETAHWDGNAFTETLIPGANPYTHTAATPLGIATAGGSTWVTDDNNGDNGDYARVLQWDGEDGGTWNETGSKFAGPLLALGADDVWTATGRNAGRLGGSSLMGDETLDDWSLLGGSSDNDIWLASGRRPDQAPMPGSLVHWDGTALQRPPYLGNSLPNSIWIGASDWGFIGETQGGLLHRVGNSFELASPPAFPTDEAAIWGNGPNDVYVVGGTDSGEILHWDGCRWSKLDPGLGPLGPLSGVWGTGDEVVIVGQDNVPDGGSHGFLLRKDASGWTRIATPDNDPYSAIWGTGANDVWLGDGNTIVRWDGTTFTATPPLPGANPYTAFKTITGSAPDDVWAGSRDPALYHYDGQSWTLQQIPVGLDPTTVFAVAKSDVWAVSPGNAAYHYDGVTWTKMSMPALGPDGFDGSIWANGTNDVWLGQDVHWDGTQLSVVAGISGLSSFGGFGGAMWGDGHRLWSVGNGIFVH
jgi:hypothetical protein